MLAFFSLYILAKIHLFFSAFSLEMQFVVWRIRNRTKCYLLFAVDGSWVAIPLFTEQNDIARTREFNDEMKEEKEEKAGKNGSIYL